MSSKNSNKINVPEARAAMDKFKMEAASEVGVNLKEGYNGDLTSREAGRWTTTVEDAVSEFYRTGYVSLDRNALYVAIDDAAALIASLDAHGLPASSAALAEARASAKQVSDAYGTVTQQDLDDAAAALRRSADTALAQLDAQERYQVVLDAAVKTLEDAQTAGSVGEYEGQHPQSAADALRQAIDDAKAAHGAAAGDADKVDAAADALRQATTAFNESIVHIDAAALDAAKRAAAGLVESQYDRAAWATMREALAAAVATDMAHISQADVDALAARLNDAIAALFDARLDRGPLSDAIASAQALKEGDYTAESWKAFAEALAAAQEECGRRSTTQGDLDKAVKALTQARDGLERKQPGGGEEPGGGEDPEQPGSGGQTERPGGVKPGAGGNANTSKPGTAGTETLSKTGAQTLLLAVTACIMLAAGFSITTARSRRR